MAAKHKQSLPFILILTLSLASVQNHSAASALVGPSGGSCAGDYAPCTCQLDDLIPMTVRTEVVCDYVPLSSVKAAFRESEREDVATARLTVLATDLAIPDDLFGGKQVRYVVLICPPSSLPLLIHRDAFRTSHNYTKILEIRGCDLSLLDYSFLTNFTALSSLKVYQSYNMDSFEGLPAWLPSLNELWIAETFDFNTFRNFPPLANLTSLSIHNCPNFRNFGEFPSVPSLRSLDIIDCPQFRQWDVFHSQLNELTAIHLSSSELNDEDVTELLDEIVSSPVSERLTSLNLRDNSITQMPEHISQLNKLTDLNLDYNKIIFLRKGSLNMGSSQVKTVSLLNNGVTTIEPEAFQGFFGSALIDLRYNNLTRLESSVFLDCLEQMANSADPGKLLVGKNPIECDCHLDWLISDSRNIMRRFVPHASCSNGTYFYALHQEDYLHRCKGGVSVVSTEKIEAEMPEEDPSLIDSFEAVDPRTRIEISTSDDSATIRKDSFKISIQQPKDEPRILRSGQSSIPACNIFGAILPFITICCYFSSNL